MFVQFHKLRDDEEGQSIVIACVALLVLAIGALATVNLGRAIHQRIGLQNTADSSAYSMAALEARAFNYYAFANRTQVVHYVSAMVLQSYLSFATFLQAVAGELLSVLATLAQCKTGGWCIKLLCKAVKLIPVVGQIIAAIIAIVDALYAVARVALLAINAIFALFDVFVGKVAIPALRFMNWLLWASTKLVAFDVATDLIKGYPEVISKNDDQVQNASAVLGTVNEISYRDAHNKKAGGDPLNPGSKGSLPDNNYKNPDPDLARAKRGMGEVTNGTRYNRFVVSRLATDFMPPFMANFIKMFQKLPLMGDIFKKFGQTKFTSKPIAADAKTNQIRDTGFESSVLAQGNVLGADDLYRFAIGPDKLGIGPISVRNPLVRGEPAIKTWPNSGGRLTRAQLQAATVSVWAQQNGGRHWRLVPNRDGADDTGIYSENISPVPFCDIKIFYANVRLDKQDKNHDWAGLVPFQDFDATDAANVQFHQPSTFSYVHKSYDQTRRDNGDATNRLKASEMQESTATAGVGGPGTINTQNDVDMPPPFKKGSFNVISRGMVYYHRPHNWEEPPNFFNPYWRAKLDPVFNGKDQVPFAGELFKVLPAAISERVMVH
jgi:hypothetical protein